MSFLVRKMRMGTKKLFGMEKFSDFLLTNICFLMYDEITKKIRAEIANKCVARLRFALNPSDLFLGEECS